MERSLAGAGLLARRQRLILGKLMRSHGETGDQADHLSRPPVSPGPGARPRRRSTSTKILGSLAALLAVVLVATSLAVYAKYRSVWDGIKRVDVSGDLAGKRPPADPHALNILVIGSDTRSGVNGRIGGGAGGQIGGARSDTIMVLHIAPGAHRVAVMSIPRDSVVPILRCTPEDGTTGQTAQPASDIEQVNATFSYGGPGCLWKTIEQTTGIHINDFVELTFIGFERVIDALHGVEVCLPAAVHDHVSHLNLSAGRHHIDGRQALAFWRTRENLGQGDDPQRIQRDQFLMASLVQGIEHSSLLKSPSTMLKVIDTITGHGYLTTDSGLTQNRMLQLGEDLRGISTKSVQFVTVPWTSYAGTAQWIDSSQTPSTGNVNWIQWVQPQANNLFNAISHDTKLPKVTKSKVKPVEPASVAVKVLNGTSTYGLGATTATNLASRGFRVVGAAGDAVRSDYRDTVIDYRSAAQLAAAQTLAKLFRHVRLQQDPNLKNATLHLILGSTFTGLKAANGNSGISNLAKTYGGISGNTNICSDRAAFAGPDGG
jgi:LCP family protein required for cell wall assembly